MQGALPLEPVTTGTNRGDVEIKPTEDIENQSGLGLLSVGKGFLFF